MLQHIERPHRLKGRIRKRNDATIINLAMPRAPSRHPDACLRHINTAGEQPFFLQGVNDLPDAATDIENAVLRRAARGQTARICGIKRLVTAERRQ